MTNTATSGAADLPEALRSIQRFEVVDCIDDKHVPAVIPKPHGPWVRYADHIAALAAGQATAAQAVVQDCVAAIVRAAQAPVLEPDSHKKKLELEAMAWGLLAAATQPAALNGQAPAQPAKPAAQQGVTYAALPTSSYAGRVYEEGFLVGTCPLYTADQMRSFADATHTLRASHGQAPVLWLSPEQLANFVDADEAQFGRYVPARKTCAGNFTMPLFAAPAQPAAEPANADSVQEDAACWQWLAEYLVGPRTDLDDELVACETVNDLRKLVKAAIKQGATQ